MEHVPFLNWFNNKIIIGGDWRFFWPETIRGFIHLPLAWDSSLNTGLGVLGLKTLWIDSYLGLTSILGLLGFSWTVITVMLWLLPCILISFISSVILYRRLFADKFPYPLIAGIIYASNTYILMIISGGQLGVALAYSLLPLVFLTFTNLISKFSLKRCIVCGLTLGFQMLLDPRLSYIAAVAIFIYLLFNLQRSKIGVQFLFSFLTPLIIAILLHGFWIIPSIVIGSSSIPMELSNLSGLKFFSFADFSHSLSLLHPNWPENIFGKTYFLQPEFIILPILAYLSLIFVLKQNRTILFFIVLGLLGVFLAKGINPPFGILYEELFKYLPGFTLFRDSTKFYILVAFSYSMLIPFTLRKISDKMSGNSKNIYYLIPFIFLLLWMVSIRPLFLGQLQGIFKPETMPNEYVSFKNLLSRENDFYRTLWIPQVPRLGYFSNMHPAINSQELFRESNAVLVIQQLQKPDAKKTLQELAIKYIVVPYDSKGEMFIKDRKYDERQYDQTTASLRNIKWIKEIRGFEKIAVFENSNYKDHFWSYNPNLKINYKHINPTKYYVDIENSEKGDVLIFSERFDRNWQIKADGNLINSKPYGKLLNSFVLPKGGNYAVEVTYSVQKWVNIGLVVSFATLTVLIVSLLYMQIKNKYD